MSETKTDAQNLFWSSDDEFYNYKSLGDLIDQNSDIEPGAVVTFGESQRVTARQLIDGDDIVEMIAERAFDLVGEHAEGFPDITNEAIEELEKFVHGWMEKHAPINFYQVINIKKHVITKEEIDEVVGDELQDFDLAN